MGLPPVVGTGLGQGIFELGEARAVVGNRLGQVVFGSRHQVAPGQRGHHAILARHQLEPDVQVDDVDEPLDRLPPRFGVRDITSDPVGLHDIGLRGAAAGRHSADERCSDTVDDIIGEDGGGELASQRVDWNQGFESGRNLVGKVLLEVIQQRRVVDEVRRGQRDFQRSFGIDQQDRNLRTGRVPCRRDSAPSRPRSRGLLRGRGRAGLRFRAEP